MTTLPTNSTILYPLPPANNQRRPFLTPIPGLPGEFLLVLDNTALGYIKRCDKAAQAYLILGREERPRSAALAYGGAMHAGLEKFHWHEYEKQLGSGNRLPDRRDELAWQEQDQAVLAYFTSNPAPSGDYRNPQSALTVLSEYRKRCNSLLYPDYEWEIQSDNRGPIIERAFEIPMGVCEIELPWHLIKHHSPDPVFAESQICRIHLAWSGRIDLIAKISGKVHIVDHKTSSIDEAKHTEGFAFASQTIGYTWAAKTIFPQFDVHHFCLNGIYFKKPAEGCGPIDRGPKGGQPALNFARSYFRYSETRINRWLLDTQLLVEDFLHSVSRNHFPLNDRACYDKYSKADGTGRCPYYDACTIDNEASGDKLLMSEAYKEVTWNPTA